MKIKRTALAVVTALGLLVPVAITQAVPQVAVAAVRVAYYGPDNQAFMNEFECYSSTDPDDPLHGYAYCGKDGRLNGVNVFHRVRIKCDYPAPIPSNPEWRVGNWTAKIASSHKWCSFPRQHLVKTETRHKVVYYD